MHAKNLPQSKILSPVENSINTNELRMQSKPGMKNTTLQLSGLERLESTVLAASSSLPVRSTPIMPANVPAVLETPITMPAYLGAISMWFTAKPALPSAKKPRATEEQRTAPPDVLKMGIAINAREATMNPMVFKSFRVLVTDKILLVTK